LELLSLKDLEISEIPDEDGATPVENALKKATSYFKQTKISTFSVDYGLYIDKFPKRLQPGLNVRRINNKKDMEVSDDEMLDYYASLLDKHADGRSEGTWVIGIALVISEDEVYTDSFKSRTLFTSNRSNVITSGEPLNSIQIYQPGKYKSEISPEESANEKSKTDQLIHEFMNKHLSD